MRSLLKCMGVGLALWSAGAFAYPELIRHGYVSCTACHVSPSGGGTLTEYGRGLSEEVLSTSSRPGEGNFLYAFATTPRLRAGGDVRVAQIHRETASRRSGRTIFMQADVELATELGKWVALVSAGVDHGSQGGLAMTSRKHWVGWRPSEQWLLRVGRFQRNLLWNTGEHVTLLRRANGLDVGSETYNLEASWIGEEGEVFLTTHLGRPDRSSLDVPAGSGFRGARNLGASTKLGVQYDYGRSSKLDRHLFGPYFASGLGEKTALLAEALINRGARTGQAVENGFGTYLRLSHEAFRGGWFYGLHEWSKPDWNKPFAAQAATAGLQFFPRPHFEVNLSYQHQWLYAPSSQADQLLLLGHIYL